MSGLEIAAVLLGIANILLIIRRSVWNYPFAIAMVSLYFVMRNCTAMLGCKSSFSR